MKEIDLLPEWYKTTKRRQVSYRTQYIGLFILCVIMATWNVLAVHSVSSAQAELSDLEVKKQQVENAVSKAEKMSHQIQSIKEKTQVLDNINDRIDIASVISEISFLLNENIVLNRLDIQAQPFTNEDKGRHQSFSFRIADPKQGGKSLLHYGSVKFRVLLQGVAKNASVVAELICRLEDSEYFFNVIPSYTRNSDVKNVGDSLTDSQQVSEFEISCYLANYRMGESFLAKHPLEQDK